MIQRHTVTLGDMPRTTFRQREGHPELTHLWRWLGDNWTHLWEQNSLERRIGCEVSFQLRRRPEPGDAVLVNRIVEEMSR